MFLKLKKVPFHSAILLELEVSPQFFKTWMKTSKVSFCRRVFVCMCACVPVCVLPRQNLQFSFGCWMHFQNQNVFIKNHSQSYLSAWDGSIFCRKVPCSDSHLRVTLITAIYQALTMCQALCSICCKNHLLQSPHNSIRWLLYLHPFMSEKETGIKEDETIFPGLFNRAKPGISSFLRSIPLPSWFQKLLCKQHNSFSAKFLGPSNHLHGWLRNIG